MPTLITIPLTLSSADARRLPANANRALHATFFRWLEQGDAELTHAVHEKMEVKPYTVAPLKINNDGRAEMRVSLLHDDLLPALEAGMDPLVQIVDVGLPFDADPHIEQVSYEELAQRAGAHTSLRLRFTSPTAFSRNNMHYLLPDATLVFASYRARWNAFAPEPLRIDDGWMDWLIQTVAISDMSLRVEELRYGQYHLKGFVGWVQYTIAGKNDLADGCEPFNALADYARFCGTGHKTTQGLGQTYRK